MPCCRYSFLGDVNIRNEQFELAFSDFQRCLDIRKEVPVLFVVVFVVLILILILFLFLFLVVFLVVVLVILVLVLAVCFLLP